MSKRKETENEPTNVTIEQEGKEEDPAAVLARLEEENAKLQRDIAENKRIEEEKNSKIRALEEQVQKGKATKKRSRDNGKVVDTPEDMMLQHRRAAQFGATVLLTVVKQVTETRNKIADPEAHWKDTNPLPAAGKLDAETAQPFIEAFAKLTRAALVPATSKDDSLDPQATSRAIMHRAQQLADLICPPEDAFEHVEDEEEAKEEASALLSAISLSTLLFENRKVARVNRLKRAAKAKEAKNKETTKKKKNAKRPGKSRARKGAAPFKKKVKRTVLPDEEDEEDDDCDMDVEDEEEQSEEFAEPPVKRLIIAN